MPVHSKFATVHLFGVARSNRKITKESYDQVHNHVFVRAAANGNLKPLMEAGGGAVTSICGKRVGRSGAYDAQLAGLPPTYL